MNKFLYFSIFALLLNSCHVYDSYVKPDTAMPDTWKEIIPEETACEITCNEDWWRIFNEPLLEALEESALANNPTLDEAIWRINEAQAVARREWSFFFPTLELNPNTLNQVSQANFPGETPAANGEPIRFKNTQYQLTLNGTYEFDLWGRTSYNVEAAQSNVEAESAAYGAAKLTLESSVAKAFYTLRSLDAQKKILEDTIKVRQDALEINDERYRIGLANFLDVSQARSELELAKADLAQNNIQRDIQEHALAVLLGEAPACFAFPYFPLEGEPPKVAPAIASSVLLTRPDVVEAERRLAALFAEEGVAYTSFFPTLTIMAQIGYQSANLSDLLNWNARFWSLAVNMLQTVFDAGRKQADFDAARARFEQAFAFYANTILTAVKEVEDALSQIKWQKTQFEALMAASEAAATTTSLSNQRYRNGIDNYLQVVTAERTLLITQLAAMRTRGDEFLSTISLIQAVGGQAYQLVDDCPGASNVCN